MMVTLIASPFVSLTDPISFMVTCPTTLVFVGERWSVELPW